MKKLLIPVVFTFYSAVGFSQNTFPTDGNVGIGTLTPGVWFGGKVLEIKGDRPVLRLSPIIDGGVSTISFKGAWSEQTPSTTDEFHLNYVSSSIDPRLVLVGYYEGIYHHLLTIKGNGNIGMGTETPTEKLSVNGKIRAHAIKVEASPWPDFVFSKDYHLPSLQQTEQHIKEKGHLPGIPPSAEVKANGIDLGDMNAKLLQKIEELTLHLIQKNKELEMTNAMLKELSSRVEKIERRK